jgi:glycosyltransferase involved in cell wall biosynthesis
LTTHIIVEQFDPTRDVPGGIAGFVRDVIRYAPADVRIGIVGVAPSRSFGKLGQWQRIEVASRVVAFMPVARIDRRHPRRRLPHAARLIAGLIRYRPSLTDAVLHCHRAEVGAAVSVLYPTNPLFQFIHVEADAALRFRLETFWRYAPRAYFLLERFAAQRAERTVVMSRPAVDRLLTHSRDVVLGNNWYDGEVFYCSEVQRSARVPEIGWAGRLEPGKDPLKAVRVFEHLKRSGLEFQAWIAGSGSLTEEVVSAVEAGGLRDCVLVLGFISPAALAERLRHSHALLMTSLWEATPRGAIEALACGVPVVSTDVGEMRSLVSQGVNGFLSPTGDAESLALLVADALAMVPGGRIAETVTDLEAGSVVPELFAAMESRLSRQDDSRAPS